MGEASTLGMGVYAHARAILEAHAEKILAKMRQQENAP